MRGFGGFEWGVKARGREGKKEEVRWVLGSMAWVLFLWAGLLTFRLVFLFFSINLSSAYIHGLDSFSGIYIFLIHIYIYIAHNTSLLTPLPPLEPHTLHAHTSPLRTYPSHTSFSFTTPTTLNLFLTQVRASSIVSLVRGTCIWRGFAGLIPARLVQACVASLGGRESCCGCVCVEVGSRGRSLAGFMIPGGGGGG